MGDNKGAAMGRGGSGIALLMFGCPLACAGCTETIVGSILLGVGGADDYSGMVTAGAIVLSYGLTALIYLFIITFNLFSDVSNNPLMLPGMGSEANTLGAVLLLGPVTFILCPMLHVISLLTAAHG